VLVLERYETYGGMTVSEELTAPGFLSDVHASGYLVAKLTPAPGRNAAKVICGDLRLAFPG
jgi:beta-carotene ketolase (CrtO type)